jgi:hypothetical protein
MRQLGLRLVPAEPSLDNDKQVDGILSESENLGVAVLMHTPQGSRDRDLDKGRQEPAAVSGFDRMLDADGHEERSLMTLTMMGQGVGSSEVFDTPNAALKSGTSEISGV